MADQKKEKKLRVFIIGNGFDLAHGIKSSYTDFIKNYFNEYIKSVLSKLNIFLDSKPVSVGRFLRQLINCEDDGCSLFFRDKLFNVYLDPKVNKRQFKNFDFEDLTISEIQKELIDYGLTISLQEGGYSLIDDLFNDEKNNKWSDIENNYFKKIKSLYNEKVLNLGGREEGKVKSFIDNVRSINNQLLFLKEQFLCYLKDTTDNYKHNYIGYERILYDYTEANKEDESFEIERAILNFNYTEVFNKYPEFLDGRSKIKSFNIHGELMNIKNPPIFGLGDEYHPIYRDFVELNEPDLLKNVKSIKYLQANVYKGLINKLIEYDKIEYVVLGHSCGMSDRTLLKELFNMEEVEKICLYNYEQFKYDEKGKKIEGSGDKGFTDYTNKLYGLSSYFNNNQIMRNVVAEFNPDLIMPQLKK